MKKLVLIYLAMVCFGTTLLAQVPDAFKYQAVLRNSDGEIISGQEVSIKISILNESSTGDLIYSEEHAATTTDLGMVSLNIGEGTVVSGNFQSIQWSEGEKFLKIELDETGGTSFSELGTLQLLSVPFALSARDVINKDDADPDPANELQNLSLINDTLEISDGNKIVLPYDSSQWILNGEKIYYNTGNVGIGSSNPLSKLEVKSTAVSGALFQVINANNDTVFAVYPDGVKIFVDPSAKGSIGGFAVSGRTSTKAGGEDMLRVTPDSIRIYINEQATKGSIGGFAVSGRTSTKNLTNDILFVNSDSTRIYVKDSLAGFGISNIESGSSESLLNLNKQNYLIGHNTGTNITSGKYNTMIGYEAGTNTTEGNSNVFLGFQTGYSNILGRDNVFIGNRSGFKWEGGYDNIFIGNFAGEKSTGGTHSILIGSEAGKNMTGDDNISIGDRSGMNAYVENYETFGTAIVGIDAGRNITGDYNTIFGTGAGSSWGGQSAGNYNVFIGSSAGGGGYTSKLGDYNVCIGYEAGFGADGSHKLFIANNSTSPLIYGEFDNELVRIYGDLQVTGTVEADYGSPSDISLKTNLVTINSGLDMIQSLIPYYFDWTDEAISNYNFKNRKQIGLIAQDVEKVLPELVSESANGYKTVDYIKLTPVLVEAIKEQQQKIEKLEKENTELLKRLDRIEEMLSK